MKKQIFVLGLAGLAVYTLYGLGFVWLGTMVWSGMVGYVIYRLSGFFGQKRFDEIALVGTLVWFVVAVAVLFVY